MKFMIILKNIESEKEFISILCRFFQTRKITLTSNTITIFNDVLTINYFGNFYDHEKLFWEFYVYLTEYQEKYTNSICLPEMKLDRIRLDIDFASACKELTLENMEFANKYFHIPPKETKPMQFKVTCPNEGFRNFVSRCQPDAIYILSTIEKANADIFLLGKHTGKQSTIVNRFKTDIIYFYYPVNYNRIVEKAVMELLDRFRIDKDDKKMHWIRLDLQSIINTIIFVSSTSYKPMTM